MTPPSALRLAGAAAIVLSAASILSARVAGPGPVIEPLVVEPVAVGPVAFEPAIAVTIADQARAAAAVARATSRLEHALAHPVVRSHAVLAMQRDSLAALRSALAELARLRVIEVPKVVAPVARTRR